MTPVQKASPFPAYRIPTTLIAWKKIIKQAELPQLFAEIHYNTQKGARHPYYIF